MLIPRKVLTNIGVACDNMSSRYALHGIQIERVGPTSGVAVATDGRRMLIAEFSEPPDRVMPFSEGDDKPAAGFVTLLPCREIKSIAAAHKAASHQAKKCPALQMIRIDESSANGRVKADAGNVDIVCSAVVRSVEGRFPKWRDVIPKEKPSVSVKLNARLLHEAIKAIEAMTATDRDRKIVLTVPLDGDSAVTIVGEGDGIKATAIVMPLSKE